MSLGDHDGEGDTMGVGGRIGGFCVCILLAFALYMAYVTLADITIPMP